METTTPQIKSLPEYVSMHDGIADWCDCCTCEAEPRWRRVAEQLGIDLSDRDQPPARNHPAASMKAR